MKRNEIHGSEPGQGAVIDFAPVLGHWINTNEKTRWIRAFDLRRTPAGLVMHARGAHDPEDWGETAVTPYFDNIGERAFSAQYDLGPVQSLLAANMNKNLWVIAAFHRFIDGHRPNFLCREFYYQQKER